MARLARLELSDDEVERFTAQLRTVLDHAADVAALDLSHLAPSSHPIALETSCDPTSLDPASSATRSSPRRPRSRTTASGSRASVERHREHGSGSG